ncbi:MAG: HAMP domain-containing protein [Anaerolineae bacterium]|nr:HAMP domain-containing protein [Anaerolineae bacterium]
MHFTLRLKLLLTHLAVIVLAMGLSGILLTSFLERYFLQATEESLIAQAQIIVQTLIPGAVAIGPQGEVDEQQLQTVQSRAPSANLLNQRQFSNIAVQTDLEQLPAELPLGELDLSYLTYSSVQLGTQLETHIRLLNTQGEVLVDSADADLTDTGSTDVNIRTDEELDLSTIPGVAEALQGQYACHTTSEARKSSLIVALPVLLTGQRVGVIVLSQPLRDVTAVLRDLRLRLLLSTAIALVFSTGVGLWLSSVITRPLKRLTAAADQIAAGTTAGSPFDVQVPVRSQDELGYLSRAFNDMTARLRAARQMQTDFVANVSHELRTPLTSIKGMVETLRDGAVDDLEVRDRFLETAETETDRLIRLVNDLLVLSRADSDALNLRRKPVDVGQLARTVAGRFLPQADTCKLTLRVDSAPDTPLAWADADRVSQVLVNLLDNALKYSRAGGTVLVRVEAGADKDIQVTVRDEGIGIPAADLSRIGQRFYRPDKSRARERGRGGTGLGLAIARALVEGHGGILWIESKEGVGTTVGFTLLAA